jgi:hypothetical protein
MNNRSSDNLGYRVVVDLTGTTTSTHIDITTTATRPGVRENNNVCTNFDILIL